ncbi:EF-hand domain-containing protein [Nitrosococcus wardiae]|uniref:EF-hand domain-containing protein n=1 Tax=Nitrosococcus wardiae TaxID=1814290 RepID=A0A4P7BVT7_9GAMM|nr:EF-hand domain-containing protein [Nitrosococcus wardiae]QBQ53387.1 EF-hand domain-containing protein [Nitrosococcus wardiae]
MVAKYKILCHSLWLGGVLSLVLAPAFAGTYGSEEGGKQKQEKEMHMPWFQKLDEDGDGKVSEDEFEEVMEEKFERMDEDDDDHITQEEWQSAIKEHEKKHHRGAREGSEGHQREGM